MSEATQADARTAQMNIDMAETFAEFEAEYRDEDWAEVVYEDDQVVVVADHAGYELSEWASELGVERGKLGGMMLDLAEDVLGAEKAHKIASSADLVVFDRFEDDDDD